MPITLSPYVIARSFTYWAFPSSTERLAYVGITTEVSKVAWQQNDDTFWVLTAAPGTWVELGTGGGGTTFLPNIIATPTTVPDETSAIVVSYLIINDDLTLNGNLLITG